MARRFANEVGVSQGNRIHLQRLVRPGVFGRERLSVLSVLAALGTTMVLESVLHGGGCLRNRDVFRPSFLSRKSWLHYDLIETVARKQVFPSDCSSIFASAAALEAADNAGCPHSSGTRRDPWLVVFFCFLSGQHYAGAAVALLRERRKTAQSPFRNVSERSAMTILSSYYQPRKS